MLKTQKKQDGTREKTVLRAEEKLLINGREAVEKRSPFNRWKNAVF